MVHGNGALVALVALTFQNTALAILLMLSFRAEAEPYAPSTAVLCTELLKLLISSFVVAKQSPEQVSKAVRQIKDQKLLLLPAFLYVVQSNLLFFASERLPPVIYIVCTQMKIFTSAVFSRVLLGTKLRTAQYISLFFLIVGIVLVQARDLNVQGHGEGDSILGFASAMLASLTSGLAGAVLEKLYKDSDVSNGPGHTVWTRNIQLSVISIPFAVSGIFLQAGKQVISGNFFLGYDHIVWGVILLQAAGGLIIAFVLKFASVVLKCLAISVSICCCAIYSVWTKELALTLKLAVGLVIVNISVASFSIPRGEHPLSEPVSNSRVGARKV